MRTVIAALALGSLIAFQAFETYGEDFFSRFTLPLSEEAGWILFAWTLCLYLVVEGIYSAFRSRAARDTSETAVAEVPKEDTVRKSKALEKELKSAEELIASLKLKLQESEEQKDSAEEERTSLKEKVVQLERAIEGRDRDSVVDAEIINLLSVLQEKGRFLDFVMDDITPYEDPQVGAAARVVHQGCREVMSEFFRIDAVHTGNEGEPLTLQSGFPSTEYRLSGNVPDAGPYSGRVMHKGWKATEIRLPRIMQSNNEGAEERTIIAPAQVEI